MSEQQQLLPDIIVFPDIKPKQILVSSVVPHNKLYSNVSFFFFFVYCDGTA
jgi:hypothetical protein